MGKRRKRRVLDAERSVARHATRNRAQRDANLPVLPQGPGSLMETLARAVTPAAAYVGIAGVVSKIFDNSQERDRFKIRLERIRQLALGDEPSRLNKIVALAQEGLDEIQRTGDKAKMQGPTEADFMVPGEAEADAEARRLHERPRQLPDPSSMLGFSDQFPGSDYD